jgi:DNA-binding transcriptional regulator YiaG
MFEGHFRAYGIIELAKVLKKAEGMTPQEFKTIRQSLGWSLSDCSRHILMSERNIRRMEDGTRPVMPQTEALMNIHAKKKTPPGRK